MNKPIYGEFTCSLDAKGRFLMPALLRKQLPEDEQSDFVINRGLDQCLVIFPIRVWEAELKKIYSRNQFVEKNRAFARMFQNGAAPVSLDGNGRLLVPRGLSEHARLGREIVLIAQYDRIEVWDATNYQTWLQSGKYDLASLSEEVMGEDSDAGAGVP